MSNSGCDIAVELLSGAKEVYLSHRSGARIVNGNTTFTYPYLLNACVSVTVDPDG